MSGRGVTPFMTRPQIEGSFGAVASTHWIPSAVAMGRITAWIAAAGPAAASPSSEKARAFWPVK